MISRRAFLQASGGALAVQPAQIARSVARVDDLRIPPPPDELKRYTESLDLAEAGIAVMLGGSALIAMVLALVVTFQHSVG